MLDVIITQCTICSKCVSKRNQHKRNVFGDGDDLDWRGGGGKMAGGSESMASCSEARGVEAWHPGRGPSAHGEHRGRDGLVRRGGAVGLGGGVLLRNLDWNWMVLKGLAVGEESVR